MIAITSRVIDDWQEDDFWTDVHARWLKLAAGRNMPERQDFRPEEFSPYLGWLSFISVLREGDGRYDFHFRVGGTEIVLSLGYEMTGKSIDAIEPPPYREEIRKHYMAVVEKAAPMLFELTLTETGAPVGSGKPVSYQRMSLPFGTNDEGVTHLLNCSRGMPEIGEILRRCTQG